MVDEPVGLAFTSWLTGYARVILVRPLEAIGLAGTRSWESLSTREALRALDTVERISPMRLRAFVDAANLTRQPLSRLSHHEVVGAIRQAIECGTLLALREGADAVAASRSIEIRQLAKAIAGKLGGGLHYGGREYKLVADADLDKTPDRNRYHVVSRGEAERILSQLAKQAPLPGELLLKAAKALTRDWRPPITQPDGLILLRRAPQTASAAANDEAALTPSQLRAAVEPDDITLECVANVEPELSLAVEAELDEPIQLDVMADTEPPLVLTLTAEVQEPALEASPE